MARAAVPALAALAVAAVVAVSAALASAPYVIRADERIGPFAVKRDGSMKGLRAAFGAPTLLRRNGLSCFARWRPHGLAVELYNLGGANPCSPAGRFGAATMTGARWRTTVGLRIGDPSSRVRRLYRRATRRGAWFWLVTRRSLIGEGGPYPGLAAKIAGGRVVAFRVRYAAGGD